MSCNELELLNQQQPISATGWRLWAAVDCTVESFSLKSAHKDECNSCIMGPSDLADIMYSTIVQYSRDHKGLDVVHDYPSPKNQPTSISLMMRQYWLGKARSL